MLLLAAKIRPNTLTQRVWYFSRDVLLTINHAGYHENVLGLLPPSPIFSLNIVCHLALHRGDAVIVLSKFVLETYLRAIEK